MRIALASYRCKNRDVSFNIEQIERAMQQVQGKVDLICFGEAFLQGFDALCWDYDTDKNIAVETDSPIIRQLARLTAVYNVALMTGYLEKDQDSLYSSCIVIENGKTLHHYRRISKGWKDFRKTDRHYKEGNTVKEFDFHHIKIITALCGDMWDFPEQFKTGHLLIWPVYVDFSRNEWEETALEEYAKQAALVANHVLMINPIGDEPQCHGGSFYFCKGKVLAKLPFDEETVLVIDTETWNIS